MTRENGTRSGTRLAVAPESAEAEDPPPVLDRAVQSRIGDQWRAMYDDLMEQPVPDRFKDLLVQLQRQDAEKTR